tara:strand:+ start:687 stop:1241 length:555 start_codon:yes stop_codon:yes gene_type:complete
MLDKKRLRKQYILKRQQKYFEVQSSFFNPLLRLIKKRIKKNYVNLSFYYPSNYEVNTLKLFDTKIIDNVTILLPVIKKNNTMHFYKWWKNEVLQINQFGMLEPLILSNNIVPDVMLVPLLAYDDQNNRLGYGGGYYDRYLDKYLRSHKNILTIGVAFSFQKYHKIPVSSKDKKLNYILTEKGIN